MKKICTKCGEEKNEEEFSWTRVGTTRRGTCKPCDSLRAQEWRAANPDRVREKGIQWRAANRDRKLSVDKKWREENIDRHRETRRVWWRNNRETRRSQMNASRSNIKNMVFLKYGGYTCCECGATDPDILTIDHIDPSLVVKNNGRREGGYELYRRLKREGFPSGYQVLCFNCNIKKHLEYERSKRVEG